MFLYGRTSFSVRLYHFLSWLSQKRPFMRRRMTWSLGCLGDGRLGGVSIDPVRLWIKVSAVDEGPLGCWPWLGRPRASTPPRHRAQWLAAVPIVGTGW